MSKTTEPEVFIIESLDFEDEENDHLEGKIISKMLSLGGKKCQYFHIRTKQELEVILGKFSESRYRYLHLSCHGNAKSMFTTLDRIRFPELAELLKPHLQDRRLFVSACSATNKHLAEALMPESGCYSILGPSTDIAYDDAAILWASLYHMLFKVDRKKIKRSVLTAKAQQVSNVYGIPLVCIFPGDDDDQFELKEIVPVVVNDNGG